METKSPRPIKPDVPIPGAQSDAGQNWRNMASIDIPTSLDDIRVVLVQNENPVNMPAKGVLINGLSDIADLAKTDGGFIVGDGTTFVLETGATARTSLGLGAAAVETYAEGTWTPDIGGGTTDGTMTTTVNSANYTRIGNLVMVEFDCQVATLSSAASGLIYIHDLPFTAIGSVPKGVVRTLGLNTLSTTYTSWYVDALDTDLRVFISQTTVGGAWINSNAATNLQVGARFIGSLTYRTSA